MKNNLREQREKLSPDIIKRICEELGITISKLSQDYGRASNYFDANQITKRGGLRPPESRYIREVWKRREVPAPGYYDFNALKWWARKEGLTMTDLGLVIGRSHSYFCNAKKMAGCIYLLSGEIILIAEACGVGWNELNVIPAPEVDEMEPESVDEFADVYAVPPEFDNGLDEIVAKPVVEEREQISLLSSFSNEELIAEVLRRMNR